MRRITLVVLSLAAMGLAVSLYASRQRIAATAEARTDVPRVETDAALLPSGWAIRPAGRQIATGDMPLSMALSPDGDYLLFTTSGYFPARIAAIDTDNEQLQTSITLDETWEGLCFGRDGKDVYVSGGGRALLWRFGYDAQGGDLLHRAPVPVADRTGSDPPYRRPKTGKSNAWIGGIASDPTDGSLYTVNVQGMKLYRIDSTSGAALAAADTEDHPVAVAVKPGGTEVWVVNQGFDGVSVYRSGTLQMIKRIRVGRQPTALLFSTDGRQCYVTNSGSNTVSVIDTASGQITQSIRTSLFPNAPCGSTPNAMALSPDGARLYVTNADNNDVAVIELGPEARVAGFIPTGWYPTSIAVSKNGKKLFVGCGKGLGSHPSYPRVGGGVGLDIYNKAGESYGPDHKSRVVFDYICSTLPGSISIIDTPDTGQLARHTADVIACSPYRDELLTKAPARKRSSIIPAEVGKPSPIKHILYVIKENRTYDQVFGDIRTGNGDPQLTLFGEKVTPNHHALARNYVLFDNLYCNGEVSEDGHQWCNAAFCTDWTEKVYPGNYATPSRGDAPGSEAVIASAGGYLWDNCAKHKLTYRTYGEFTSFHSDKDGAPVATSASPALRGHISTEWEVAGRTGKSRDYQRVDAFISELDAAQKTGEWPAYMVMALPEDHTVGLTPGRATPWAAVASNDYALGKLVDAVSHSRFWASTAIFVIEDDAQAGPDHVDAHRTVGLVISPYTRRKVVDHTLYTTSSFLRTMELLLGLPPMTQYDAGATPLYAALGTACRPDPYVVIKPLVDLNAKNPQRGAAAQASLKMDFSAPDRCDPDALNRMLWQAIKGDRVPYPGTTVSARLATR